MTEYKSQHSASFKLTLKSTTAFMNNREKFVYNRNTLQNCTIEKYLKVNKFL